MTETHEAVDILLVEDNPDDIELALFALKKNGLANQIHIARDGVEAVDFLFCRGPYSRRSFENSPKFVLLDLKLPKMDGLEVIRAVKSDPRTKSIPIVVMTSSKEHRDMVEGYQLGVNSYIQKPIDFNDFRDLVKQLGYYWLVVNQLPQRRS